MIPMIDLSAQYRAIKPEVDAAIQEVIDGNQFILGPAVERFERAFATYCQTEHAVGVSSGTSALHIALLAAGVGPGDEVITVAQSFTATAAAVLYCGAKPIFVDVEPDTALMDASLVEAAITDKTKAILPVHLYGHPVDIAPLLEIADRRELTVIEDAAQAHGAEYHGRRAGSLGHLACFSFYPGKNLGAFGEGGAVTTSDAALAERMKAIRTWGQDEASGTPQPGFNYRMDGIQGAVLDVKLRHLDAWTDARRARAATYKQRLDEAGVDTLAARDWALPVYHQFIIRLPGVRDRVSRHLRERGVDNRVHYATPIHLQPAYRAIGYKPGDLPVTEALANEVLSLPLFPEMNDQQQAHVIDTLTAAMAQSPG